MLVMIILHISNRKYSKLHTNYKYQEKIKKLNPNLVIKIDFHLFNALMLKLHFLIFKAQDVGCRTEITLEETSFY